MKLYEIHCHECGIITAWTGREDFLSNSPMFCHRCVDSLAKVQLALGVKAIEFENQKNDDAPMPRNPNETNERQKSFLWNWNITKFWLQRRNHKKLSC